MNALMYIFLIHGLGGSTTSLKPLKVYLEYIGYSNIHMIEYPSRTENLNMSVVYVK